MIRGMGLGPRNAVVFREPRKKIEDFFAGAISMMVHILALTFVWVGFSVPNPRESVRFYYTGSSLPREGVHAPAATDKAVERAVADPYPGAYFAGWLGMRDVDKPRQ